MGNKIAKNTLFLYFRLVFLMLVSFYTSRKLLQLLGIVDFGIYNVVGSIVAIFGSLKGLMTSSTQRYLNFEMGKGNYDKVGHVFSMSVIIHIIIATFFFLLVEVFGLWYIENKLVVSPDKIEAVYYVFHFSLLTVIVSILTVPYDALIIAHERMKIYAYVSILDGVLKLIMILILLNLTVDNLIFYSFFVFCISCIIRVVSSIYCRVSFSSIKLKIVWNSILFKDMLTFSGWQFLGNSSFALQSQGVNMLLNFFYGPILNTARGLSLQVQGAIQTFTQNILIASNPQLVKSYAKGDSEGFFNLLIKVSKYSFVMIMLMLLPLLFYTNFLLTIWLEDIPEYLVIFIQTSLAYSLVRVFHNPLDSAIKATGNIRKYQIVDSLCLLISLPVGYCFLVLGYHPVSVIVAMIIVELLTLIFVLIVCKKVLELSSKYYLRKVLLPCFGSLVLLFFLFVLKIQFIDNSLVIMQIGFLIFAYCVLLMYFWNVLIDNEDKNLVINKIFLKFRKNKF